MEFDKRVIAERFAALSAEKRSLFLRKLAEQGIEFGQLPIVGGMRSAVAPLSYAQQRLWFLWQLEPDSAAYNMVDALRLSGALSMPALQRAFDALVARHESLRTTFGLHDGEAVQRIHAASAVAIERIVLASAAEVAALVQQAAHAPFDLERGPLLRVQLLELSTEEHVLVVVLHHIVSDGWSMGVVVEEFAQLYAGFSRGESVDLAKLGIQYADYAVWQRHWLAAGERDRQLAYWQQQLAGEQPVLELPTDHARPAMPTQRGARLSFVLGAEQVSKLKSVAQRHQLTVFMLLLAAFKVLLYRYTGQKDLRVGLPSANRHRAETQRLVGFFVNTQVIRTEIDGSLRGHELFERIRKTTLDAQSYQDLPFEQLVEALQPERSLSRSPLFQVMLNHQRRSEGVLKELAGNLRVESLAWEAQTSKFDLSLDTAEIEERIVGAWTYSTDLFEKNTIERLSRHWQTLLNGLLDHPEQRIGALPLLDDTEQQQLRHWNASREAYAWSGGVHALIEAQAQRQPDAEAVVMGERVLSYAELNRRSNRIAHALRARGIGPESKVGLLLERRPEMIVGLLAILKSGAAYVPLDPEYPPERLAYMVEDSGIGLLLTQQNLQDGIETNLPRLDIDADFSSHSGENPHNHSHPEHLAYIIYTSGSTGRPKGVMVSHGPLAMHCQAIGALYGMTPQDRELQFASIAFDGAHERWLTPLVFGSMLMPRDNELWSIERCVAEITRHRISIACFTPGYLRQLAEVIGEQGRQLPIRSYTVGGEGMPRSSLERVQQLLNPPRIINGYGPTETVITPLLHRHYPNDRFDSHYLPIGRAVGERTTQLLDADLNPVPVGVTGELYIGGAGLARGYWNRPGLTAERFVPDPFNAGGQRLYRTGDLARYRDDGVVEYLGRVDQQVKIRGFRIELGEIEARLLEQAGVREALVIVHEASTGPQLAAYVVGELTAQQLKANLQQQLPDYLVPAHIQVLDTMPLTPNGKLDRRALPAPSMAQRAYRAPQTPAEQALAGIWQRLLKLDRVGLDDHFFELGGDSIVSIQMVSRARTQGWRLTPKDVFQHPTLEALSVAARIEVAAAPDSEPASGAVPLTPIQRWFFDQPIPARHHWNQAVLLQAQQPIDADRLEAALRQLLAHHDALRMRYCRQGKDWIQSYAPIDAIGDVLWRQHLESAEQIEAICNQAQASLNLEQGPLLRAVLMTLPGGRSRLLLAIHHLVIDGVSWRILLEDLQHAYDGQALPPRSSAFQAWAERLQAYAQSQTLQQQRDWWMAQIGAAPASEAPLAADRGSVASASFTLCRERTRQLLQQAPAAYRTQVNDLLLTALSRALCAWSGEDSALLELESHGRDSALAEALDLTRTLGWFTCVHPLRLRPQGGIGESIKAVKEQLRAVPDKGLGYGLLLYLGTNGFEQLPRPRLSFNYLGQIDASFDRDAWLLPAVESAGASRDALAPLDNEITVNGRVQNGELTLRWRFDRRLHDPASIAALVECCRLELLSLIEHCVDDDAGGVTPSDFPLARVDAATLSALDVDPREIEDLYPLTALQQGVLFHALQLGAADPYYNQTVFEIEGALVSMLLDQAWRSVVARHTALRSVYLWEHEGAPLQLVLKQVDARLDQQDWRSLSGAQQTQRLADEQAAERIRGFAFGEVAQRHPRLLHVAPRRWWLLLNPHHIVLDGWSTGLVFRDLLAAYRALESEGAWNAPPAPPFSAYVAWQQRRPLAAAMEYWKHRLAGFDTPTPLPCVRGVGHAESVNYAERSLQLPAERYTALQQAATGLGITLSTLVQAAWALLLARHADADEVLFGVTVSGRSADLPRMDDLVGLFINTLPIRVPMDAREPVGEWLRGLQRQNAESREHEHTPLPDIQRAAATLGGSLFDCVLVFENYPIDEVLRRQSTALTVHRLRDDAEGEHARGRNNYPLSLIVSSGASMKLTLAYQSQRHEAADIERLLSDLRGLLERIAVLALKPEARLSSIALPDACEGLTGEPLALGFGDAVSAFRAQWARSGTALAAQDGSAAWTRAELEAASNRLSAWLRSRGVAGESRVALCAERSLIWLSGVLGIFKSGGVWVALDPQWPAARVCELAAEAGAELILSSGETAQRLQSAGLAVIDLDTLDLSEYSSEPVAVALHPHQAAYLIYTSGSTGKPKGVTVSHGALAHYAQGFLARAALPADASLAMISTTAADLGHTMLFGALFGGHALHLIPTACAFDADRLAGYLSSNRIDVLKLVPSHLRGLLSAGAGVLPEQLLVLGGEASRSELIEQVRTLKPDLRILNHYGPTETTVGVLTHEVQNTVEGDTVPTGLPLPGTTVHILDRNLNPVPQGVTGELYIGGPGVARGYWNRPELTAERFIPDPQGQGRRLYRSGDRVRLDPQGRIEFLGRADEQIKIRGNRIELGEVERALRQLPNVRDAAVVAKESEGRWQLLAYAVSSETGEALQAQLRERLPEAMLPAHLITLEQLPLTPNGKLDRKALPDPDRQTDRHAEPETDLERQLAAVWKQVLKIERVGRHDHFFALGGDSILSLQVIALARRQGLVLSPKLLLGASSLADLARQVDSSANRAAPKLPPIPQADRTQPLPLSYAQQRLWFLWKLDPDSAAYNIPRALRLRGPLSVSALQRAFDALVARHESLRTCFRQHGEQALQQIGSPCPVRIEHELIADDPGREALIKARAEAFIHAPFDLERGPLLRVQLLELSTEEHVLVVVLHHIVSDGWSMGVVVEEFAQLYAGFSRGESVDLAKLGIQYADYAVWQRHWLAAGERDRQLAYWQQQLAGEQPVLELPTDHARPAMPTQRGARLSFVLGAEQVSKLKSVAQRHQLTVFMLLLAAFKVLLYRYTGQKDLRVGLPSANRHRAETQRLVGFFVNTQVIRTEIDGSLRGHELFERIRKTTLDAQSYQDLPFEQLVEALQPERSLSRSPLFQVMLNHQRRSEGVLKELAGNLRVESLAWEAQTSKFDLSLDTAEIEERIVGAWTYSTDLFEKNTIERLSRHWQTLLNGLLDHPEHRIGALPLLDDTEQQQLRHWNASRESYAWSGGVHALIEAQAQRQPDAEAVVMGERVLSYAELNRRSNRIAHALRARGIGPESKVGLLLERRPEMIVGLLAILKSGAAYVPLDPEYPPERLAYMVEDSGIGLLLTQQSLKDRIEARLPELDIDADHRIYLDTNPDNHSHPEHLAYIIYTSGSTGRPKGVMVSHGPLAMHCQAIGALYGMTPQDRELQFASIAFDGAHERSLTPLVFGSMLMPRDNELWSIERCVAEITRHRISIACFTPGYLRQLAEVIGEQGRQLPIRSYTVGGEGMPRSSLERVQQLLNPPRIINGYGPTETVITPLLHRHYPNDRFDSHYLPIGRAVGERTTQLLDTDLNPVPVGVTGELYIGGAGLARGYWNRPGLTAERFVPDPFNAGGHRLYRTGDLARYRDDGVVEYLGRVDQQVKIRGFRIELGEIEARLLEQAGVREALVIVHEASTGPQLAAYVVGELTAQQLKANLQQQLPDYLVPAHIQVLDTMPLTPNGKLDRRALPAPSMAQRAYRAPQTPAEQALAGIWQRLLKLDRVGLDDHFFELGGDSLLSLQLVAQARQQPQLQMELRLRDLMQAPTIEGLLQRHAVGTAPRSPIDNSPASGAVPLTPIQRWFFDQPIPARHHWNQSVLLQAQQPIDADRLEAALQQLLVHHDALRMRYCRQGKDWIQSYAPIDAIGDVLWRFDLESAEQIEAICNQAQASLNLEQGPLLRAVLMTLPGGRSRLLLAIHHLVIDGVSWRILLEDLQHAYDGQALPPRSSAFKAWAERLQAYAQSQTLLDEAGYWLTQGAAAALPRELPAGMRTSAGSAACRVKLDAVRTRQLLQQAPAAYGTQINELLLTALARSLCRWSGQPDVQVQLEGHGREPLFDDVDLSRTIGWFTSVFPLRLQARPQQAPEGDILSVRKSLRAIPNKGIGYGLLRHLGPGELRAALQLQATPAVTFNYLGQISAPAGGSAWFEPARESGGRSRAGDAPPATALTVNCRIYGDELSMSWSGDLAHFQVETIEALAQAYLRDLNAIIEHCVARAAAVPERWSGEPASLLLPLTSPGAAPALYCVHASLGTVFDYLPLARAAADRQPVYGIQSRMLVDPSWTDHAIPDMAQSYVQALLDRQPQGPYRLLGWSFGAVLAMEMAAQLERRQCRVAFLGLVDAPLPGSERYAGDAEGFFADLSDYLHALYPRLDPPLLQQRVLTHRHLDPSSPATEAAIVADVIAYAGQLQGMQSMASAGARHHFTPDEAVRGFVIRRRQAEALRHYRYPALSVAAHCWWAQSAPGDAAARLEALLQRELLSSQRIGVGHLAIVKSDVFLKSLLEKLPGRRVEVQTS